MIMENKETSKHIGDKSVQNSTSTSEQPVSSTTDKSKRIARPTKFKTSDQHEADASASTKNSSVNIPSGPILSMNDSLNALTKTLSISSSSGDQGQGDVVVKPPQSPDSFISSTCSGDIDSPTTSGPDTNPESDSETSSTQMGGSGPSSPTSSATSSGMSIGPEYAHSSSYPQPSVRPKEHRNATWPEGLTSSSVGAGISTQQRHNSNSEGSLPLDGTVTREGEMVSYVADDLLEKIRRSASPRSKGTSMTSSPTTISPSSSRSSFASSAIPPIDPTALADLEKHSKRVADSLDLMMGHLNSTLHNMSAISVGHVQTYRDAVEKAGLTVDQSVKAMYALIAKCEELSRTMVPVQDLAKQIKSIKKQLDELEAVCK